jgi:aconitate hydratase 2/2-methylisocitrate dehydratase
LSEIVVEEIKVITYTGEGDISTDLLSPGTRHTKIDRELHGKCLISPEAQDEIKALAEANPDKSVNDCRGTMGVGSRMSV